MRPGKLLDKRSWIQIVGRFYLRGLERYFPPAKYKTSNKSSKSSKCSKMMSRLRPPAPSKPKLSEKYKHLKNSNIYRVTPLIYKKGNSRFTRLFQKIIKITAVIKITLKKTFGKNISYLRLYEIFVKCSRIPKSLKISPGFLFVLFNLILKSVFEFLTKGFCERDSFFKLWDWEIIIPNKLK